MRLLRSHACQSILILFLCVGFLSVNATTIYAEGGTSPTLHIGEKIYREGILSDGSPLRGYIKGDVEIDSTVFSCANCHTRSGLGSVEGQVTSPPINGASLFKPRFQFKDQIKNSISKSKGKTRPAQALRPEYTDSSLASVLRGGIDPTGRPLSPVMPRYNLNDQEMKHLVSYLKNLSNSFSPGVADTSLSFATIVTDDVSPQDRQALLASLETLVAINQHTKTQKELPQFAKMFRMLDNAFFRNISVKTWELHGAPSTWRKQLEEYNKKEPVFAILGGISNLPWQPIHDFCEDNKIPCLFPITDLPVISNSSWYTYYASKGYYQEGETAARYLLNGIRNGLGSRVLQITRPSHEGNALASGFLSAWNEAGIGQLHSITLDTSQVLDADRLKKLLSEHSPDSVVIWDDVAIIKTLSAVAPQNLPQHVIISSRYTGSPFMTLPEAVRSNILITYPFRLPDDEKAFVRYKEFLNLGKLKQPDEKRIVTRTFSMVHMFLLGLKEIKLDYYRDTLLDVISMRPDQYLPDFERYSFGPGQRYSSKGCYIVSLGSGPSPQLIKKSDWVTF